MQKLKTENSPFLKRPSGIKASDVTWLNPKLLAQIKFSGWTQDEKLRHPSFKGLREDKSAKQVGRDRPQKLYAVPDVVLSNADKVLFQKQGLTKQHLADYYLSVAEWILPYVANRPLSLKRCPEGSGQQCFFQKHPRGSLHPSVRTVTVNGEDYISIENVEGILGLVQFGVLEIHSWGAPNNHIEQPDMMVFDLDPGPRVNWKQLIKGAKIIHQYLLAMGLESFAKITGSKGIHVVLPLDGKAGWDLVKQLSKSVAETLNLHYPDLFVAKMSKKLREEKIFVDYLRNTKGATSIANYSTRARLGGPVATPVSWQELNASLKPDKFTISNLQHRLKQLKQDPWKDFFQIEQTVDMKLLDLIR